jgi:hypothetical protein
VGDCVAVQLERSRQSVEHLRRGMLIAALLSRA